MPMIIRPAQELAPEIRRLAAEQTGRALQELEVTGPQRHQAIHKARQRFKRLRGLLRLIRPASECFYADQNRRLRDAGRALAGARTLTAMIETIDRLDGPENAEFAQIRDALEAERAAFDAGQDDAERALAAARGKAQAAADAFAGLHLVPGTAPAKLLTKGVGRTYRQARRALKAARRTGAITAFHELRKHTKYHHLHLKALREFPLAGHERIEAVKALAAALGDLHDVDMLLARLAQTDPLPVDPCALDRLRTRLQKERIALAKTGLGLAAPIYRRKTGTYLHKVEKHLSLKPPKR